MEWPKLVLQVGRSLEEGNGGSPECSHVRILLNCATHAKQRQFCGLVVLIHGTFKVGLSRHFGEDWRRGENLGNCRVQK